MTDDPVNQAIEAILAPHRAEVPTHRWNHWRAAGGPVTVPYGTEVQIAARR